MHHTDEPFDSPKLLIARAKENLEDFRGRYKAFLEERPYETVSEDDPKSGDKIMKIRITKPVPGSLRTVFSDALNNMRHALDHAVNDAAVALRGGARNCYFPFGKNASEFALIYASNRYKTVPIDLRPHIDALQPYFGGNDILYGLGRLSGPNKHQLVMRLVSLTSNAVYFKEVTGDFWSPLLPIWNSAKGELPIIAVHPGGHVNANFAFEPTIAIDHPAAHGLQSASGLSDEFLRVSEGVVLGIEAETNRLLAERKNGHLPSASAAPKPDAA